MEVEEERLPFPEAARRRAEAMSAQRTGEGNLHLRVRLRMRWKRFGCPLERLRGMGHHRNREERQHLLVIRALPVAPQVGLLRLEDSQLPEDPSRLLRRDGKGLLLRRSALIRRRAPRMPC